MTPAVVPRSPTRAELLRPLPVLAWALIIVLGHLLGAALVERDPLVHVNAPPLVGSFDLRLGPSLLPAALLAAAVVAGGPHLAERLRFGRLLLATWATGAAWAVALAASSGWAAVSAPLSSRYEYLGALPEVPSPGRFLDTFVSALASYPTHVKGHPPGMVLVLWGLDRVGLGGATVAAALVIGAGALAAPAVLAVLRALGDELAARRAAPYLALAPAAVWLATSADALFAGVAACGIAAFACARRPVAAFGAGLLLGSALLLSYGIAPLGLVVLAIAVWRRAWRPLAFAAAAVAAVFATFALAGFWWLDGLQATRALYETGVAGRRPYGDFLWINLAAFALAVGPAAAVGIARARGATALLVASALAAVAVANLSGLSRGETERIWLPFVPFVVLAAGATRSRALLAATAVLGLALPGADDYVVKPFSPAELVARVDAVLRRVDTAPELEPPIELGELVIDPAGRRVTFAGAEAALTQREFDLLLFLARHPGQAFTRNQLMDLVWQYSFYTDTSTVTVHIRRLRAKIEPDPAVPRYVQTVWGVGYRFAAGI